MPLLAETVAMVKVSPSGSLSLFSTVKTSCVSSVAVALSFSAIGASLTLITVRVKACESLALLSSVTVKLISYSPTALLSGVPIRLALPSPLSLRINQLGKGVELLIVRLSPLSISLAAT